MDSARFPGRSPEIDPQTSQLSLGFLGADQRQVLPESLAMACLLIFSRSWEQTSVGISLRGDDGVTSIAHLEVDDSMTLGQLRRSLRREATAPEGSRLGGLTLGRRKPAEAPPADTLLFETEGDQPATLWMTSGNLFPSPVAAQDFLEKIALVVGHLDLGKETPARQLPLVTAAAGGRIADPRRPIGFQRREPTPEVFLRVAEQYPDAPAVSGEKRDYSYRTLRQTAQFLAGRLLEAGLQPGDPVLVSGPSSFGTIAGFLAAGLSGGVLVSLDRNLPDDRQRQIVDLSEARYAIVATTPDDASVPAWTAHPISLPAWPETKELARYASAGAVPVVLDDQADAYVFFTSGSTGVPKGVLGWHQGLAHFLDWQRSTYPLGPGDRSAQITALSFDVVLRDIFYPLTSGACVCVPDRSSIFDARRILKWIEDRRITILHSVPSLMKAWLQAEPTGKPFGSLKYLFFAGEPLPDDLLGRFQALAGEATRITNLYGPTETTLAKLSNDVTRPEPGIQPIGLPQPGVDVLILRDRKTLCGLDEVGEIVIRTPYRSKGYFKNQALTDEVFLPNPWASDPDDLLYCTGDLGKVRDDGKVMIYGRIDGQIKIRGVRIEPNEIEAHIRQFPGVTNVAVMAQLGANQEKTLFAFVVLDRPLEASRLHRDLREFLQVRLPDVMVPKMVVPLDAIPQLPNGKTNRKALQSLAAAAVRPTPKASEGQDTDEEAHPLVVILEKALGYRIDDVGLSFTELGGDSLTFIRVSMSIEKHLGWLPQDWEKRPFREILSLTARKTGRFSLSSVSTPVAGRAVSILNVLAAHFGALSFGGSNTLLFLIAGTSIGRYQLPSILKSGQTASLWKTFLTIALPTVLLNLFEMTKSLHHIDLPWLLMINSYASTARMPGYWFINVLLQIYAIFAVALAVPSVRERLKGRIFEVSYGAAVAGLLFSAGSFLLQGGNPIRTPAQEIWLVFLGIALSHADSPRKKALVAALLFFTAFDEYAGFYFSWFPLIVAPILLFVPRISLPRPLAWASNSIAGASLYIYLTHWYFQHLLLRLHLSDPLVLIVGAAIGGVVVWKLWDAAFNPAFSAVAGLFRRGKGSQPVSVDEGEH